MDPPGRRVLAIQFICKALLAPTAIGFTVYYLALQFGLAYKPLLALCGVIVGWPVKASLGVRYRGWRRTHKARAFAAVTASESRGKLFYDIDILQELRRMIKDGFIGELICFVREPCITLLNTTLRLIGEFLAAHHEKAGSGTFATVVMGNYFISTTDPGNVKTILATEFNNFEKGTSDHTLMRRSLTVFLIRFHPT